MALASLPNSPPVNHQQFKAEEVAAALLAAKGLVSVAARTLGCTPHTVRNYIARYASVAAAQREARESILDLTEARLFQAIDKGEPWAITSTLRTIGKDRGYVERIEQDHRGSIGTYQIDIGNEQNDHTT
jgi:hypothetical protein